MILDMPTGGKMPPRTKVSSMKRRTFTTEFRHEAAALVLDQGYTQAQACEAMSVGASAMRRWIEQLRQERGGKTPAASPAMTSEHRKIQELEARIRKIEREKEILKKATALLMSDSLDQFN